MRSLEEKRKYNREYQRKRRAENPLRLRQIRAAYHLRHPDARKLWNEKRSAEYVIWATLKQRCHNPDDKGFKYYGAKGVKVCERWRNSFSAFIEDMGKRPSKRHSIDRFPDNKGDYEPANCRWATWTEQARNKRNNHLITHNKKTQCLAAWADETGISEKTLWHRSRKGLRGKQLFEKTEWRA